MERRIWSRDEFTLVMNLYTKIPYGQFHASNPDVRKLARLLDRTPGAVAYKLVHFSGLDPYHKNRGIKGLANPGNNAIAIYNEFIENWDEMLYASEELLAKYQNKSIEETAMTADDYFSLQSELLSGKKGVNVDRLVKTRVNQSLFRKVIIGNYYSSCAVCKVDIPDLLIASHILKWSKEEKERLNPRNGICLCSVHDRAFELGYLGIDEEYKISISKTLAQIKEKETFIALFQRHDHQRIFLPDKFYPNIDFLSMHYHDIFKG
jgi:putative restriction endonuclease